MTTLSSETRTQASGLNKLQESLIRKLSEEMYGSSENKTWRVVRTANNLGGPTRTSDIITKIGDMLDPYLYTAIPHYEDDGWYLTLANDPSFSHNMDFLLSYFVFVMNGTPYPAVAFNKRLSFYPDALVISTSTRIWKVRDEYLDIPTRQQLLNTSTKPDNNI